MTRWMMTTWFYCAVNTNCCVSLFCINRFPLRWWKRSKSKSIKSAQFNNLRPEDVTGEETWKLLRGLRNAWNKRRDKENKVCHLIASQMTDHSQNSKWIYYRFLKGRFLFTGHILSTPLCCRGTKFSRASTKLQDVSRWQTEMN